MGLLPFLLRFQINRSCLPKLFPVGRILTIIDFRVNKKKQKNARQKMDKGIDCNDGTIQLTVARLLRPAFSVWNPDDRKNEQVGQAIHTFAKSRTRSRMKWPTVVDKNNAYCLLSYREQATLVFCLPFPIYCDLASELRLSGNGHSNRLVGLSSRQTCWAMLELFLKQSFLLFMILICVNVNDGQGQCN